MAFESPFINCIRYYSIHGKVQVLEVYGIGRHDTSISHIRDTDECFEKKNPSHALYIVIEENLICTKLKKITKSQHL